MALFSSHQLFLLSLVFLPLSTLSIDLIPYKICRKNFTKSSILQSNTNNVLLDMVAKSSLHGYAISTYGTNHFKTAYGVTRCQGDLSIEACSACITNAAQTIRLACPDSLAAAIWYEECFLRYNNVNFLGHLDKKIVDMWTSAYAIVDPKAFIQVTKELMGEIMMEAATRMDKFSYGEKYMNDTLTVYGMAQCTRDIGKSECIECLTYAFNVMIYHYPEQDGYHIFSSSCVARFEIYKFLSFNSTTDAAAPTPSNVINS